MLNCRVLCASHLISQQRYLFLLYTIDNILKQSEPIDFYISIYTTSLLKLDFPIHPRLHIYYQNKPLSQFEHFYFLAKLIENPKDTFCLFCDDDDFSHYKRIYTYIHAIDIGQQAMLVRKGLLLMYDHEHLTKHTFEKCEEMRLNEKAEIVDGLEYFMYCVRTTQLLLFCQIMEQYGYLNLNICDILFGSVLFFSKQKKLNLTMKNDWIYAYSSRPKNREIEYQTYRQLINNKSLLSTLRKTFYIPDIWKGQTYVYGEEDEMAEMAEMVE